MDEDQQGFAPQDAATGLSTTSIAFPIAVSPGWQVAYDQQQWVLTSIGTEANAFTSTGF